MVIGISIPTGRRRSIRQRLVRDYIKMVRDGGGTIQDNAAARNWLFELYKGITQAEYDAIFGE